MKKGTKVHVIGIVSDRGVKFDSLSHYMSKGITGTVYGEVDEVGCVSVEFPDLNGWKVEIPLELLMPVRERETIKRKNAAVPGV